ncbi:hypothetical protein MVEG_11476 [Podila verticillata NRRL 6337]|uniref:NAD-dependent epimerase/dehydratase domain-containing protein n=1 Tax=Podila verticillata NRRL 6337 TaxID=1069443 RepID=A0A086TJY8_9FUNG|nr:hypothetical protein MVEG_11476 [Podila verticillata NRRL 6337]
MTKTIFITGATGFIGQVVAQKAVQQGYTVRGLSRREEGDQLLQSLGVTPSMQYLIALNIAAINAMATPLVGTNKRLVISSGTAFIQPDPQGGETFEVHHQ